MRRSPRIDSIAIAALAVAASVSCSRTVRTSAVPVVMNGDRDTNFKPANAKPRQTRHAAAGQYPAPNTVTAVMNRQVINAVDAGEGDLRVKELRRQVASNPTDSRARLALAAEYARGGFPELAADHYRLAAAAHPDLEEAHLGLVRSLRSLDLDAQALEVARTWVKNHPAGSVRAFHWLGILEDEAGELPAAEAAYRRALDLDSNAAEVHNNLGYNLLLQGRADAAAAHFEAALRIEPRSVIARNNLGLAMAAKPKEAVLHWQSVSDPASAHNNLAAVLMEKGDYEEARKELTIALGYRADHPAALRNLQLLSALDGRPPQMPREKGTRWKKIGAALRQMFGGSGSPDHPLEPVRSASSK